MFEHGIQGKLNMCFWAMLYGSWVCMYVCSCVVTGSCCVFLTGCSSPCSPRWPFHHVSSPASAHGPLGLQVWATKCGPKECLLSAMVRVREASSAGWKLHFAAALQSNSVEWVLTQTTVDSQCSLGAGPEAAVLLPDMWVECAGYLLLLRLLFSCVYSDSLPPYICLLLALVWHHLPLRRGVDNKRNTFF